MDLRLIIFSILLPLSSAVAQNYPINFPEAAPRQGDQNYQFLPPGNSLGLNPNVQGSFWGNQNPSQDPNPYVTNPGGNWPPQSNFNSFNDPYQFGLSNNSVVIREA